MNVFKYKRFFISSCVSLTAIFTSLQGETITNSKVVNLNIRTLSSSFIKTQIFTASLYNTKTWLREIKNINEKNITSENKIILKHNYIKWFT